MSNDGGGKGNGGGDQGRGGRHGRNSKNPPAKGSGSTPSSKFKGQLKDLPDDIFDFGSKGVADQMRRTWEKIVNHAGSTFGADIDVELGNPRSKLVIPKPQDDPEDLARHEEEQKVLRETRTKDLEDAIANRKALNDEELWKSQECPPAIKTLSPIEASSNNSSLHLLLSRVRWAISISVTKSC
jgi:hypothetical protein